MPEPLDARERRELSDLFEELGPDAPTLCEGWTTEDLAAHLVVRERHPTAAGGILIPALEQRTEQFMDREKEGGYPRLVDRVRCESVTNRGVRFSRGSKPFVGPPVARGSVPSSV